MQYEVQGQKGILIQLDRYPEDFTQTSSGVIIPQYKNYETDGGRPAASIDEEVYTSTGTVLQISHKAKEELEEQRIPLSVGDRVMIQPSQKNPHNWFFPDRHIKIQDFTGLLLVGVPAIQAKIYEA